MEKMKKVIRFIIPIAILFMVVHHHFDPPVVIKASAVIPSTASPEGSMPGMGHGFISNNEPIHEIRGGQGDDLTQIINHTRRVPVPVRKEELKNLILSRKNEGVAAALAALGKAVVNQDESFKKTFMELITGEDSDPMIANILTDAIIGILPVYSKPYGIPDDDVEYGIKIALITLRSMPEDYVGDMLAKKYSHTDSEDIKERLKNISNPLMFARLASDAYKNNDNEALDLFLNELAGIDDTVSIKAMMRLAGDRTIPFDTIAYMLSCWTLSNSDEQTHDILDTYLNTTYSSEQRALAAYAMGFITTIPP